MYGNILILCDSRQKKDNHITSYFDENNILWQRATLESGDYMAIKLYAEPTWDGNLEAYIYKDFSTIIDTKKDILEIVGNLCRTVEHQRILREIAKAKEEGCERFIFLIADSKIKDVNDLENWSSPRTQVKGSTLAKIMNTMAEKYKCMFVFCKKQDMGKKIVELLS